MNGSIMYTNFAKETALRYTYSICQCPKIVTRAAYAEGTKQLDGFRKK